jgi:DNA-binding phage protein
VEKMSVEEIRSRLADCNLSKVAKGAGVSVHSLYRLMRAKSSPRHSTVVKVGAYLTRHEATNGQI